MIWGGPEKIEKKKISKALLQEKKISRGLPQIINGRALIITRTALNCDV